jgi:hypothetical protein
MCKRRAGYTNRRPRKRAHHASIEPRAQRAIASHESNFVRHAAVAIGRVAARSWMILLFMPL